MLDQLLDVLTGGLQILPGVKVGGMLGKILADGAGHGQTQVGVNVDLAHGALGGQAQLLLGDADLESRGFDKAVVDDVVAGD